MKNNLGLILGTLFLIVLEVFIFTCLVDLKTSDKIQAGSIVALVFVTLYYAFQTRKLVDQAREQTKAMAGQSPAIYQLAHETKVQGIRTAELADIQKLLKVLEYNERRLHQFFNPLIYSLDEAINKFGTSKLEDTSDQLKKPKVEILYKYAYMLTPSTYKKVLKFFTDLFIGGIDEHNRDLKEGQGETIFKELTDTRRLLHEQRTIIESFLRENYPFPEIQSQQGKDPTGGEP
jgi:uncharacterized membrane protein